MSATRHWLIQESVLMMFIIITAILMFLDAFPSLHDQYGEWFFRLIYVCMVYFLLEVCIKMMCFGVRDFFKSAWNQFDFCLVLASIPMLIQPWVAATSSTGFLLLRIGRLLLLFKLLRLIPNGDRIWHGLKNALKASVGVIFALLLLNFLFAMGATYLFGDIAPQYFGDPLSAMYSMFKVFTIEGWFEIPDAIAALHPNGMMGTLIKGYFIVAVLFGGILGLSIANAVFIDEMTMDNTATLEQEIAILRQQQTQQIAMLTELQSQVAALKPGA